jgi:hypothetical protein
MSMDSFLISLICVSKDKFHDMGIVVGDGLLKLVTRQNVKLV